MPEFQQINNLLKRLSSNNYKLQGLANTPLKLIIILDSRFLQF